VVWKHSDLALLQRFIMQATTHVEFSSLQAWLMWKTPVCSNVYAVKWLVWRKKVFTFYMWRLTHGNPQKMLTIPSENDSLLIPKHLNDILPLQMAEHTMKELMLLLPFCTFVMTDETLLRNMQWKLMWCLTFVTLSNWWLTSKYSHYYQYTSGF